MSDNDPDMLVDLMAVSSDFEGEVIVQSLEAEGIPAWVFSAVGRTLGPLVGATMPIRVQVRRCDVELAREALKRDREESVDLDWDQVDLGDPEETAQLRGMSARDRVIARMAALVLILVGVLMIVAALRNLP